MLGGIASLASRIKQWITFRRDLLIVVIHILVVVGLVVGLAGAQIADEYFNRGVVAGRDGLVPIPHTDLNPVGVNTFLDQEPDPEIVERSMDMIAAAGIGYVRQIFGWFDIEPLEKGVYVTRFGNSSWEKFDRIVDLAAERNVEIVARLEKPPAWAREGQPDIDSIPAGPPNEIGDWVDYVAAVVTRYQGKIRYYQLWNEPNLEGEWGGQPIDAAGYLELLESGYRTIKSIDPDAVVLLAGLAPTDQRGPDNVSELIYLQDLYDLGGGEYFDIVTAMVYGYGYSPYDRRVEFPRNNFSRVIQVREIMERNEDSAKPVWAVEYGWVSLPSDWQGEPSPWGEPVSRETQARYLIDGYQRAQREWPWMGPMLIWTFRFSRPPNHEDEAANPTRGFALVEHDFSTYPAYESLIEAGADLRIRGTGAYPADGLQQQLLAGREIQLAFDGQRLDLQFVAGDGGHLDVSIDGSLNQRVDIAAGERTTVTVARDLPDGNHSASIRLLVEPTDNPPRLTRYVISRQPLQSWIYHWIDGALILAFLLNLGTGGWAVSTWLSNRRTIVADSVDQPSDDSAAEPS